MTDIAIQNAERERDALAAKINTAVSQIEEWKREISRIDQFVSDWHRFAGTTPETATATSKDAAAHPRRLKNSPKEEVAKVTRQLIELHGAPIQRPVLLNLLRERGLVIEGSDPETVLSTMLWRMSEPARIIHLKGTGYWTSERDWGVHQPSKRLRVLDLGPNDEEDDEDPRNADDMRDAAIMRQAEQQTSERDGESEPS